MRYWSEPLSTDISFSFGDKQNAIQFPLVTLCNTHSHAVIQTFNCSESPFFMPAIFDCLRNDKAFRIDNYTESFQVQRRNVLKSSSIWTGPTQDFQNLDESAWTNVYNEVYGLCFTLDLSVLEEFEYVQYPELTRPLLILLVDDNTPWKKIAILLHTKNDLPDARIINGISYAVISSNGKQDHYLEIRKKISKRESTKKIPCTQYGQKTCQNIEDNALVLDKFNCQIPILYHGQHLNNFVSQEIMNCSNEVTHQALNLLDETKRCNFTETCKNTRFTTKFTTIPTLYNKTSIVITFDIPEVEHHNTYISYDLLMLIGEVGGLLGLTIGASALTLSESLLKRVQHSLS